MTQKERILEAFQLNHNALTPGQIMGLGIAQYNARIKELRDQGHLIENQSLGHKNGVNLTRFIYSGLKKKPSLEPSSSSSIYEIARVNRLKSDPNLSSTPPSLFG